MACVIDKGFTADRETALLDTDPGVLSGREPIEARFELVGKRAKLPFTHKFILVIPVVGGSLSQLEKAWMLVHYEKLIGAFVSLVFVV